jgi:membrane-associated phospholipid phosphatase
MRSDLDARTQTADTTGMGRFGLRALLGCAAVLVGVVPFLLLWLLVRLSWSPLASVDAEVAAGLNEWVSRSPVAVAVLSAVTDLGGTGVAVLVLTLTTVFLLIRRHRRLAAFVATTGVGLAVLGPVTKVVVDRTRPVVDFPVVETPSNASFPSGHAMTALVTWGALLLVALPSVRRRVRPWLVAAAAVLVVVVGLTRLALGVHFVSDVLAGWALGAGWLAATTAAFRVWQHERGVRPDEPLDPLDVPPEEGAHLAASPGSATPGDRRTTLRLLTVAAAVVATLTALGLLVTGPLTETWVGRWDRTVVAWFVEVRSTELTAGMDAVGALAGARTVAAAGLALAVTALAVTGSWRPVVFVGVTLLGEVVLYWLTAEVVDRVRPAVADLTSGLPRAASWPSGHVAAAVALYGAMAVLVLAHGRSGWRWIALALPVLVPPAVGVSRVYAAAHHPTDVLAGLLLGGIWVYACARLLPRAGRAVRARTGPVRPTS